MIIRDAGDAITLSLSTADFGTVSEANYRIINASGATVQESQTAALDADQQLATVEIAHSLTALPDDMDRMLLVIRLEAHGSLGSFVDEQLVMIRQRKSLVIPAESFQTVNDAILRSMDIIDIDNWHAADADARRLALIEAGARLKRIRYLVFGDRSYVPMNRITIYPDLTDDDDDFGAHLFEYMDRDQFLALPRSFLRDLYRAQIIEADMILGPETAEQKRLSGIMSDTVGETSQMFRTGRPIELPVCKRAFREISRWLDNVWRIGRG